MTGVRWHLIVYFSKNKLILNATCPPFIYLWIFKSLFSNECNSCMLVFKRNGRTNWGRSWARTSCFIGYFKWNFLSSYWTLPIIWMDDPDSVWSFLHYVQIFLPEFHAHSYQRDQGPLGPDYKPKIQASLHSTTWQGACIYAEDTGTFYIPVSFGGKEWLWHQLPWIPDWSLVIWHLLN